MMVRGRRGDGEGGASGGRRRPPREVERRDCVRFGGEERGGGGDGTDEGTFKGAVDLARGKATRGAAAFDGEDGGAHRVVVEGGSDLRRGAVDLKVPATVSAVPPARPSFTQTSSGGVSTSRGNAE